jgi:hypothetical protein
MPRSITDGLLKTARAQNSDTSSPATCRPTCRRSDTLGSSKAVLERESGKIAIFRVPDEGVARDAGGEGQARQRGKRASLLRATEAENAPARLRLFTFIGEGAAATGAHGTLLGDDWLDMEGHQEHEAHGFVEHLMRRRSSASTRACRARPPSGAARAAPSMASSTRARPLPVLRGCARGEKLDRAERLTRTCRLPVSDTERCSSEGSSAAWTANHRTTHHGRANSMALWPGHSELARCPSEPTHASAVERRTLGVAR